MKNLILHTLYVITIFCIIGCQANHNEKTSNIIPNKRNLSKTVNSDVDFYNSSNQPPTMQSSFMKVFCDSFDLSESFKNLELIGAFGKEYYRIDLIIDSIVKVPNCDYKVFGSTTLKGKTVSFNGEMIILDVIKEQENLYGFNDSTYFLTFIRARCSFEENPNISGAGTYSGELLLSVHIKNNYEIDYKMWEWAGDGYSNYNFRGNWTSRNGNVYQVYFADGKLEVGDLNVGDGEFVPNKKYIKNGWFDYAEMFYSDDTTLMKEIKEIKENINSR